MKDNNGQNKSLESKTPAGLAGAGGGTLIALFASSLDDPLKEWLLYAAPSISVALSGVWIWAQVAIGNYFRDKEVELLIDNAKEKLEEALKNESTSDEHKEKLRDKLEKLELINVDRFISRVDSLEIITTEDIETHNKKKQPTQKTRG